MPAKSHLLNDIAAGSFAPSPSRCCREASIPYEKIFPLSPRHDKFGLFIYWGIYAIPAGYWKGQRSPGLDEWIMNRMRIPVTEYEQLAQQFNPVKFDADLKAEINAG